LETTGKYLLPRQNGIRIKDRYIYFLMHMVWQYIFLTAVKKEIKNKEIKN
jgi:hypothetical protein